MDIYGIPWFLDENQFYILSFTVFIHMIIK